MPIGAPFRTIRAGSPSQVSFHLLEVQAFLYRARFERNSYFFETHRNFVYERVNYRAQLNNPPPLRPVPLPGFVYIPGI